MATDENLDNLPLDESDEKLDDELLDDKIIEDSESEEDTSESETSEDEKGQSEDEESDDSSSQDEESDEDDESDNDSESEDDQPQKRTPEQIANYERKRRKKAERELRLLKRGGRESMDDSNGSTLPPGGLADRVWRTIVKVDISEIAQSDPTIYQRAGVIKKIIFDEMPELQKKPDGVKIANEIALGRLIKRTPGTENSAPVQRKTSPAQPRTQKSRDDFKPLTQAQFNRLTPEQQVAYENAEMQHIASKRK